jgi:Holliday junction resolvasome RuvABC ATP-dependent DNA helicase subunit
MELWVFKYAPNQIDDYLATEEIKEKLKIFIEQQSIPNLPVPADP